jgi:hypothetical protein
MLTKTREGEGGGGGGGRGGGGEGEGRGGGGDQALVSNDPLAMLSALTSFMKGNSEPMARVAASAVLPEPRVCFDKAGQVIHHIVFRCSPRHTIAFNSRNE